MFVDDTEVFYTAHVHLDLVRLFVRQSGLPRRMVALSLLSDRLIFCPLAVQDTRK